METHVGYTPEYVADRLEIQDLCTRYGAGVDRRDWDLWESCFTEDAIIDYTAMGGIRGGVKEVRAWMEKTFEQIGPCQHLTLNAEIEIDGDVATARTGFYNPMTVGSKEKPLFYLCGGWYCDQLVRTSEGWKFRERVEEDCFDTASMKFFDRRRLSS